VHLLEGYAHRSIGIDRQPSHDDQRVVRRPALADDVVLKGGVHRIREFFTRDERLVRTLATDDLVLSRFALALDVRDEILREVRDAVWIDRDAKSDLEVPRDQHDLAVTRVLLLDLEGDGFPFDEGGCLGGECGGDGGE
jgi:hypothetical protein